MALVSVAIQPAAGLPRWAAAPPIPPATFGPRWAAVWAAKPAVRAHLWAVAASMASIFPEIRPVARLPRYREDSLTWRRVNTVLRLDSRLRHYNKARSSGRIRSLPL